MRDNVAGLIVGVAQTDHVALEDGDVVVVTYKIASKAICCGAGLMEKVTVRERQDSCLCFCLGLKK